MLEEKNTWLGEGYGESPANARILILSAGNLKTYCQKHQLLNTDGACKMIKKRISTWKSYEEYNPLNKFEWAMSGHKSEENKYVWNKLALSDEKDLRSSLCRILDTYMPTHVIIWGRMNLWALLQTNTLIAGPDIVINKAKYKTGIYHLRNGDIIWLLGIGNPARAFPWLLWHDVIRRFLLRKPL